MKLNTPQQQFHAKQRIQNLIESGHLGDAEKALNIYERAVPDDQDIYMLKGVLFLVYGKNQESIHIMQKGLRINPRHYNLHFNIGYLFEQQGEILDAFNSYRQAEYSVQTSDQLSDLKKRIRVVKEKIKSRITFGDNGYQIKINVGKRMFKIDYHMDELLLRKNILNKLLQYLDPQAKTALEIESGPGIITRVLAATGVNITGVDSDNKEILRALAFEMQEKVIIKDQIAITEMYNLSIADGYLEYLPAYDVIILSPSSFNWYTTYPLKDTLNIINSIAHQANLQMFLFLPPVNEENQTVRNEIKEGLIHYYTVKESTVHNLGLDELQGDLYKIAKQNTTPITSNLVPFGLESVNRNSDILEVELDKCQDIQYFSYNSHGWHPFKEVIKEYLENPDLTYSDSILKIFYDKYQPKNRQEQWLEEKVEKIEPLCYGWPNQPWYIGPKEIPKQYITDRMMKRHGNQHFGPNSKTFGEKQYKRIIATYQLIRLNGYQPEIFPDGYIAGYLLVKDDDYRFVIIEGQHRIAALSILGVERIHCKFNKIDNHPPIIQLNKLNQWGQVKNGLYSKEVAEMCFLKFFHENGKDKAHRIGMDI